MLIRAVTLSEVWKLSIEALLKFGYWVPTERGLRALEVRNLQMQADDPKSLPKIHEMYPFSRDFAEGYARSFFSASSTDNSIYGRLYEFGGKRLNQVSHVCKILKDSWSSRRGVITTWLPDLDLGSSHPPCILSLQFLIRDDKLHLSSVLRSNDAWLAAPCDMLAISNLQQKISEQLGLEAGEYNQISISYHIYEMDYPVAKEYFG